MKTLTTEDLGMEVAAAVNGSVDFSMAVSELGNEICDELIHAKVTNLRLKAEKDLGIAFTDEDKHYDFAMNFEGDLCRMFSQALAKFIREY